MPVVLPNTTTTANLRDTHLGGGALYQSGGIVVANNPVAVRVYTGRSLGESQPTDYPYITPTVLPLNWGSVPGLPPDYITGFEIADAIPGSHAQVSGWLVEAGRAGIGSGTPFLQTISSTGQVSTVTPALLDIAGTGDVNPVTVQADVPGASITFTVNGSAARFLAVATFDYECSVFVAASLWEGLIVVDGATAEFGIFQPAGVSRQAIAAAYGAPIAKGAHTVKLSALRVAGTGTALIHGTSTRLDMILLDQ